VWFVPVERPIWAPFARWAEILLEERATVRWNCSLCGTLRSKQGESGWQRNKLVEGVSRIEPVWQVGRIMRVRYEAKETSKSRAAVKKAVKKVGSSRKPVERRLGR
jgi:hypothetical protein